MTWLKICGITRSEDALLAATLGADAVGMVFAESPRRLDPEEASGISRALPASVLKVGVFRNATRDEVLRIARLCELDMLQFHGDEDARFCESCGLPYLKAVSLDGKAPQDYGHERCFALLADAPGLAGGSGIACDWELAARLAAGRRLILAGGLRPDNVAEAMRQTRPFGADVSSGVEAAPGKKDAGLMRRFVREVKEP